MAKITEQMVDQFNEHIIGMGCVFKLEYIESENPRCQLVPACNIFINSCIINPTKEFYLGMENYFRKQGIELTYNNTGSIFWSASGWSD